MLLFSKTEGSAVDISAIVHFLYFKFDSFSDIILLLLLATCLQGPECFQVIHMTKSSAMFSFFWQQLGFSSKRNFLAAH